MLNEIEQKYLKEVRKNANVTQAELAERISVDRNVISRLENGGDVNFSTVKKVLEVFNLVYPFPIVMPEEEDIAASDLEALEVPSIKRLEAFREALLRNREWFDAEFPKVDALVDKVEDWFNDKPESFHNSEIGLKWEAYLSEATDYTFLIYQELGSQLDLDGDEE